ncbi:DUF305 domain-containing protein [Lentzea flaviverrucosa]|uniref:Uncharacterized conserved protein, DUF305 family n=1 Tax=Lentzea flaviverrucosa TaxID=200379 RepID=A0A1H9F5M3_9PSEU|nr:DUF305 domain-containing protein [Lentzea flaviverrucosa]RDI35314.1 uncharacterized protein (DUF305 family) [Lentzea flaviverrucosa]SEQ32713.1 Uncharacterized conserved protein, DUF305 family [Lentzea flaviverrucosa]
MRKSLIVAGFATVALVTGCGSSNDMGGMQHNSTAASTPASGQQAADHNDHDVQFAQEMIAHHQQAVDMAKMVPGKSTNPKVTDLAKRIEGAQDPEIKTMTAWLSKWGASPTASSMPGMDHGSMGSGNGMMTAEEMTKLGQATGAAFDKMWMEMMIKHHEGAIAMAKTHIEKGSNADSKKLAQEIITAQQAEITEMQGLLKQG